MVRDFLGSFAAISVRAWPAEIAARESRRPTVVQDVEHLNVNLQTIIATTGIGLAESTPPRGPGGHRANHHLGALGLERQ